MTLRKKFRSWQSKLPLPTFFIVTFLICCFAYLLASLSAEMLFGHTDSWPEIIFKSIGLSIALSLIATFKKKQERKTKAQ